MTFDRVVSSIATRIIVLGISFLVLGTVIRYHVLSQYLREDIGAVMAAQQLTLANYVAREVDHKMQERQSVIGQMASTLPPALLRQPDALRAWLEVRHNLYPLFTQGLVVSDTEGHVLAGFPLHTGAEAAEYGGPALVDQALRSGFVVGRPVRDTTSHQAAMPVAATVKDASGVARAVLIGLTALDAPGFLSFSDQDRIGEHGGFLLISPRDNLFIASTHAAMVLTPTPPAGVNPLHDRAMQGYRGTGVTFNAQGVEEISAIASVPSTGWFVVARMPTSEALAVVARTQRFVALNSIVVVLAFLLISVVSLAYVFRPLLQTARQADRMTLGEAPLAPLAIVRNDEVGHLTAAFNRLLSKLQASQAEMTHMAQHDALTGLPNRALLADRLSQALSRADRNGNWLAFLYIDLDRFKPINDQLGHGAGDEALRETARRLTEAVRDSDTLARIGGDEFVVLLADLHGDQAHAQAAACAVAAKCLEAMTQPLTIRGEMHGMGASIGIAMGNGNTSAHELQVAADGAMYQAKQAGGNRWVLA